MRDNLRRVCELQTAYSSKNTPEMQERGALVRRALVEDIRGLAPKLSAALGPFGSDFLVEGSDGIGRKTELAWVRFCSESMSPSATSGFYVVLHFSTDGSGVNVVVGCSSSKFLNGYSVVLPASELDKRCAWMRQVVSEERGSIEPFVDGNNFGARANLPKSFERASALIKKIAYADIEDDVLEKHLVEAAHMLQAVYTAQRLGRELSPADQSELEMIEVLKPAQSLRRGQGFGLNAAERKAVERQAMKVSEAWLTAQGYTVRDRSASRPYDFEASREEKILLVEVKGTTSDFADSIAMTHGEVALHRANKGFTALLVVSSIRLNKDGLEPLATGGVLEPHVGWNIDEWTAEPTAFRLSRKVVT